MAKRLSALVVGALLISSTLIALPAAAQDAPREVPAEPNIVDEKQDSNGLTPQGGPAGGVYFTRADIWAGWFTVDAEFIYAHLQTELGGRTNTPYFYRFRVDPGTGTNCLWLTGTVPSALDPGAPSGQLRNRCDGDERTAGEMLIEQGPDGTGVYTIKIPRSAHPVFADGGVLKAPSAEVTLYAATSATGGATAPTLDNTKPGTDYVVGSGGGGGAEEEPKEEEAGESDPPKEEKKQKKCKKGSKKKKCKKPKKTTPPAEAEACPAYVPGEEGAEAETTVVTDEATEEKPVVIELDAGPGLGSLGPYNETTSVYQNVQVDTSGADTGLYAKLEFQNFHDYDLYLNYADGSTAANSGDFNVAPGHDLGSGSPDGGWEAGTDYEMVMGIRTADCAGYTARMVSWLTNGGAMTLSLWLGDVVADPNPPEGDGEAQADALSTFYGLLGL